MENVELEDIRTNIHIIITSDAIRMIDLILAAESSEKVIKLGKALGILKVVLNMSNRSDFTEEWAHKVIDKYDEFADYLGKIYERV